MTDDEFIAARDARFSGHGPVTHYPIPKSKPIPLGPTEIQTDYRFTADRPIAGFNNTTKRVKPKVHPIDCPGLVRRKNGKSKSGKQRYFCANCGLEEGSHV